LAWCSVAGGSPGALDAGAAEHPDAIGKAGASFKSVGDARADTTSMHGRLMLTILGGLAEFERELILARTETAGSERRPRA
jgi:DNA invertase Pin-like site-specific DNA recombinase